MVFKEWTNPIQPNYIPFTPVYPDPIMAQQMLDILDRLDKLDKKIGAIDCLADKKEKRNYVRKLKRRAAKKITSK